MVSDIACIVAGRGQACILICDSGGAILATMNIRVAQPDDIAALVLLWRDKRALLAQTDARFTDTPQIEKDFERWLQDPNCAVFVGMNAQGRIMGYVIGCLPSGLHGVGMVADVALEMHSYQKGLARDLLAPLRDWFAERGVRQVIAAVPRRSAVEQAFWRAMGAAEWMDLLWVK
jgi:L-amino acid N-acyltransferase YncA